MDASTFNSIVVRPTTTTYNSDGSTSSAGTAPQSTQYLNPTDAGALRLTASGIPSGANNPNQAAAGSVFNFNFVNANGTTINPESDWRVRISMQPATASLFYGADNPLTRPLAATNGVIFPYTPQVQITHQARYASQPLTHSNYNAYFYEGSEVQAITINGDFTVQNTAEGQYLMAAIQFFRSCTKMFFGNSPLAGTPPALVFLDGYGSAYLPHIPCVVTSFAHTMPSDVDYVEVAAGVPYQTGPTLINVSNFGVRTRLPTMSSLSVTLQPVYSRNNISRNFTLENFVNGGLIQGSTSPRGGFI